MNHSIWYLGFLFSISLLFLLDASLNEKNLIDQTLDFVQGHREFKDIYFKQHEAEFIRLVQEGQHPQILFISCSDSRVVPDLILNARPGELFVIRNAGNFVPPLHFQGVDGTVATIQYAVEVLNVKHIIVCGHSNCGAIHALFKPIDSKKLGILEGWLKLGEEAKQMALVLTKLINFKDNIYSVTEKISVVYQLEHLMTYPFVKKRVEQGSLELHGWYFKIETGDLWYFNGENYQFVPLLKSHLEKK